jgi:hypothetical protein
LAKFTAKYRYTLGVDLDVGKRREANVYIRQQVPANSGSRSTVLGLGYQYTLR